MRWLCVSCVSRTIRTDEQTEAQAEPYLGFLGEQGARTRFKLPHGLSSWPSGAASGSRRHKPHTGPVRVGLLSLLRPQLDPEPKDVLCGCGGQGEGTVAGEAPSQASAELAWRAGREGPSAQHPPPHTALISSSTRAGLGFPSGVHLCKPLCGGRRGEEPAAPLLPARVLLTGSLCQAGKEEGNP